MRLREIRKEHNYKLQDVADYLCCTVTVYGRYEKESRMPSIDILLKLSKLYNVSVDFLIGNDTMINTSITQEEAKMITAMRQADERACADALVLLSLHMANK